MEAFAPLAALSAIVYAVISLLRFAKGRDWNGVFTILSVWVAGFVVLLLFAQSDWAETLVVEGIINEPLSELSVASLIILGFAVGSTATAFNEVRGAIDRHSSTAKPKLVDATSTVAEKN